MWINTNPFRPSSFGLKKETLAYCSKVLASNEWAGLDSLKTKHSVGMCMKSVPWSLKAALQLYLKKGQCLSYKRFCLWWPKKRLSFRNSKDGSDLVVDLLICCDLQQGDNVWNKETTKTGLAKRFMASESNSLTNVKSLGQLKISRQKISRGLVLHWCFGESVPKSLLSQQLPFLKLLQRAHRC